jgi:hypothetical protein
VLTVPLPPSSSFSPPPFSFCIFARSPLSVRISGTITRSPRTVSPPCEGGVRGGGGRSAGARMTQIAPLPLANGVRQLVVQEGVIQKGVNSKRCQEPLPERPGGCCAQRFLTPFRTRPWPERPGGRITTVPDPFLNHDCVADLGVFCRPVDGRSSPLLSRPHLVTETPRASASTSWVFVASRCSPLMIRSDNRRSILIFTDSPSRPVLGSQPGSQAYPAHPRWANKQVEV